ncbi:MAG: CoA-transferase subunit beta [Bacillota bacterium]
MTPQLHYTRQEMMAVAASRELRDGERVVMGIGLPQVAVLLAQMTHAPFLQSFTEMGIYDAHPIDPAVGLADPRIWYGASCLTRGFVETLGVALHRGKVDVGLLGTLEVDSHGNLNSTLGVSRDGEVIHLTGSGGANDIGSLARKIYVICKHQRRKFPPKVRFITTPGHLDGGHTRREAGLRGGGTTRVFTDLAVLGVNDDGLLKLISVHPGVSPAEVQENTGFQLDVPREVPVTPEPTGQEIRLIREVIDPTGMYTAWRSDRA